MSAGVVEKVLEHLFSSLTGSSESASRTNVLSASISKIAKEYPQEWCVSLVSQFSRLEPAANKAEWICLLSHISEISPFPSMDAQWLETIIDRSVTSLHSVDQGMRVASFSALRTISSRNASPVLAKVCFSLKIYALNGEILDLLKILTEEAHDISELEKLLKLYQMLLCDDLHPDHLGRLGTCISQAFLSGQASELSPIYKSLYEQLFPLCWKQNLMNSSALFGIFEAVITIIPNDEISSLASLQNGIVRLLVCTRSVADLVSILGTVRIMASKNQFLVTNESVSSAIPILIDIGISLGPLSLLSPNPSAAVSALLNLFSDMTEKGRSFLLDRISMASKLSLLDRLVSIIFLSHSIVPATSAELLVTCIDSLCAKQTQEEAYMNLAILNLLFESAKTVKNFQLTVPMVDFVIKLAVMDPVTDSPSSLRQYWFSMKTTSDLEEYGPSSSAVREIARDVLIKLSLEKEGPVLQERVLEKVAELQECGLKHLLKCLPEASISNHPKWVEIFTFVSIVWSDHEADESVVPGSSSKLKFKGFVDSLEVSVKEEIFAFLLSKKMFERCDITKCVEYANLVFPHQTGLATRVIMDCVENAEQEILQQIMSSGLTQSQSIDFLSFFGNLISSLSFSEFQTLQVQLNQLILKSRSRLVVFMGLKRSSSDLLLFLIARTGLGAFNFDPLHTLQFLDPCVETLKEVVMDETDGRKSNLAPDSLPVIVTLETLAKILSRQIEAENTYLNNLMSLVLPLVVFQGESATGASVPLTSLKAMEVCAKISKVENFSISTKNFQHSIQFAVSVLVHGISSFSTIDTALYADRIAATSTLLISVLSHSFNVWLGLSRLAQLLSAAGTNSPLPILRAVTMEVFAQVARQCLVRKSTDCMQWLECLVVVIPRTKDPVTTEISFPLMNLFADKLNGDDIFQLTDPEVVPDDCLVGCAQLLLHASCDAHHESAIFVLSILNALLSQRGHSISQLETANLVSHMFSLAEKSGTVQSEILQCVHALCSIHLNSSLKEIVHAAVETGNISESQQEAIRAIAKEKKLLVGFVSFMNDLMINTAPEVDGNLAREPIIASKALQIALSVDDSLVPAMVSQFAPELLGSALLLLANTDSALDLIKTIFLNLNVILTRSDPEEIICLFADNREQVPTLVNFIIPFLHRHGPAASLANQRDMAERILCTLTEKFDTPFDQIRTAFAKTRSGKGLSYVLKHKKSLFRVEDLHIVVEIANNPLSGNTAITEAVQILILAAEMGAKIDADPIWKTTLLATISTVTDIIVNKINSENVFDNVSLFKACLTLASNLCQVAAFTQDTDAVSEFKSTISKTTLIEIQIRRSYLSSLKEDYENLCEKTLDRLEKIAHRPIFTFRDFENQLLKYLSPDFAVVSRLSASRSPLVVEGAAIIAVAIANSSPAHEQTRIIHAVLRLMRTSRRKFLADACKERVAGVLGDIVLSTC